MIERGVDQVFRLQLPFERTILVVLTMATALASATIVALFGIRATTDEIVNPAASYPLAALNSTFFESSRGGGIQLAYSPVEWVPIQGRVITGLKMQNSYMWSTSMHTPYLPEQGPLGDTIYGELNTGGVGLNASSYLQYSGVPDGFKMPARFEFNKLYASVFGTHVSVSCQNVTSKYTTVDIEADIGGVRLLAVGKPGGPNITLFRDLRVYSPSLVIGSAVTVDSDNSEPTQTLAILGFSIERVFVLE
ncbi:hypothetical protein FGG08_006187 [Glutinoglossum americanum]|uniref:Uncharacterized protein n=1 Tax=Glutinoglossum americanum TaxID=1670608 RepID=A0A9P8I5S4_9PEZI|nr:hypothetical protein FGG08_006187 [Glutinoglossum americanum]